ncbi:DUF4012 domain-containing protein [Aeromicrobium alkaliterrae]|uniref:DUF4012 domain-containing protein n=1 Tax=Aeromicrobium alkaliterrae TaxID=302168 RepID=A0ABN2JZV6_9ACTN
MASRKDRTSGRRRASSPRRSSRSSAASSRPRLLTGRQRTAREKRERQSRRKAIWLTLAGIGVVLVAIGGWLGWEANQARTALAEATDQATALQREISEGDTEQGERLLAALQVNTEKARTHTDGLLWSAAAKIPFVGDNARAVTVAADALDAIAQDALPPVVSTATALDSDLFKPVDGVFPLATFAQLVDPVSSAAEVLTAQRARIDALDPDALLGPVRKPVEELQEKVGTAETAAAAAARAMRLAPAMLGGEGPRTYLVMFQNNAESRSTGGIPGSVALVRADGGRLTFGDTYSYTDIGTFEQDVIPRTEDEALTFSSTIARDLRDTTLTPDFPRAAQFAKGIIEQRFGVPINGVISVDPVALSYALDGTGPVGLPDGTVLTGDNAVTTLLSSVYARFPDPREQDEFFSLAAQTVFTTVLNGQGDYRKTLEGLTDAVDEHRLLIWSADPAEQAEFAETPLAGALPQGGTHPRFGVYVNDATSSKMQFYLRWDSKVEAVRCLDDDRQELALTVTLTSTAPADAALLPSYIVGPGTYATPGTQQVNLRLAAPSGSTLEALEVDGVRTIMGNGTLGDRPIVIQPALVGPGQEVTLRLVVTTGPNQPDSIIVDSTPGVVPFDQDQRFASACG